MSGTFTIYGRIAPNGIGACAVQQGKRGEYGAIAPCYTLAAYTEFKNTNMKQPTTPYSIAVQEEAQVTRKFLESEGWKLIDDKPLFDTFEHTKNADLKCSIGLYGCFSIVELHWCNKTPEREFSTINKALSIEDYRTILRLLNIRP